MDLINHVASTLRRGLCVLLSVLILSALLFPGVALNSMAAEKTVTVPHPADYFGTVTDTSSGSTSKGFFFEGYSSYPKSRMESYIKALKEHGLTGGTIKDDDGDKVAVLKWAGKEEMWIRWDKGKKHMFINISQPLTVAMATGTTITDDDTAETLIKNADGQIIIPDPQDYFGTFDRTSKGGSRTVYHCNDYSSYPKSKMESYVKALKEVGLTGGEIVRQDNGDMLAQFYHDDSNCISIRWYKKDQYVWFNVSNELTFTTGSSNDNPSIIDFLESCFGTPYKTSYDEENYITYLYFKSSSTFPQSKFDKMKSAAEEYNLEFNSAGFRNSTRVSIDSGDGGSLIWGYWFKNQSEIRMDIKWEYVKKSGKFDTDDIPDEPVPPKPTNGTIECGTCRGRRYCQDCNGKGEEKKPLIGQPGVYTTKTCGTCHGLKKCPTCEGHGWVSG